MCLKGDEIHCFTSLYISKVTKESTTMYRADPYFYKKPWMDWCNSIWELKNHPFNCSNCSATPGGWPGTPFTVI